MFDPHNPSDRPDGGIVLGQFDKLFRNSADKFTEGYRFVAEHLSFKGVQRKSLDRPWRHGLVPSMAAPPSSPHSRIRLFRSASLERLTVVSAPAFIALWAILLPAIAVAGASYPATPWIPVFIVAGLIAWTATEYMLHRFVFHFEPDSQRLQRVIFIIHGNHHADPKDPLRNLMPPIISLPVGGVIWVLSFRVFGPVGTWFFLGFMTGYVGYDLVHYACHQWPMRGRLARALKTHHMHHHHHRARGNYAITGMVWDRILSTRISSVKEQA
ncbi:MAG: sterol desaturase family protein [Erythrobacter sp.]|jgi:sterol desaturase/sphingolipid hydroxylase (fatty acid hydroxylase superfamily)